MRHLSLSGIALIAAVAGVACAHNADAPPPAAAGASAAPAGAAGDDEAAAELKEHHRHHSHGGVAQFIAMSLDTLGTADEAKRPQIEKLQGDLKASMAPARAAEKNVLQTLADGVAAGTIDTAKVDAAIAQLGTAASGVHDAIANTLNELHALLTPPERNALVEKVQAHWQVWQSVNHEAEAGGRERGGHLARLTEELSLQPDQVDKISAALHTAFAAHPFKFDPKDADAHVEAFVKGFAADTFDAKTITANANAQLATHGSERTALFYETVTPLLTPDQRTKLADHLREHSTQPAPAAGK